VLAQFIVGPSVEVNGIIHLRCPHGGGEMRSDYNGQGGIEQSEAGLVFMKVHTVHVSLALFERYCRFSYSDLSISHKSQCHWSKVHFDYLSSKQ